MGTLMIPVCLDRVKLDVRMLLFLFFQIVGMVIAWLSPYWQNMIGIGVLTFGFQGALALLLSATSFKTVWITQLYQFGNAVAPVLGIILIEISIAANFSINSTFTLGLMMSLITGLAFFLIIEHNWNKNKADQAKNIQEAPAETSAVHPLSFKDKVSAFSEAKYYLAMTAFVSCAYEIYTTTLVVPTISVVASGLEMPGSVAYDNAQLASHITVFFIGFTALVPQISSRMHKIVPFLIVVCMCGIALIFWAQLGGFFQPMSFAGYTVCACLMMSAKYFVSLQLPLMLYKDENLTRGFRETQLVMTVIVNVATALTIDIIAVSFLGGVLHNYCTSHVALNYANIKCTF